MNYDDYDYYDYYDDYCYYDGYVKWCEQLDYDNYMSDENDGN